MGSRSANGMFILTLLMATVTAYSATTLGREDYAGDEACRACHSDQVESYWKTAHHLTSRPPAPESILGSFSENKNILRSSNPSLYFRMDSKPDGFYETAVWSFPAMASSRSERIDAVIGSGRVGQTYLYWKNGQLFQLPVSYWVDLDAWVNSPGYRDGTANFARPVPPRCLECHLTYAVPVEPAVFPNRYQPQSLIFGISCERCHGPGREHIEAMRQDLSSGYRLPDLAKLTRDRQMDVCAQCHGGRRIPQAAAFSYVPGKPLDENYRRDQANPGTTADVHGNQVALLQMSRCYQASPEMVCSTCHDVHKVQRDAAAFSDRCLQCHRLESCGQYHQLKEKIRKGCADCHMPVQASNLIISNSNGKRTRAMVRSHWIKVYADSHTPPL
jgi:Cytochrome c554 and c-prime